MKRIVLDTNVIISAFFWKGYPRTVYDLVKDRKITLLSCFKMEAEFIRVLAYPRFGLSPSEIMPLVEDWRANVNFVEVKSNIGVVKEDPTDNIFLECAVDGKADYIVSGDYHLLGVGSYEGIHILRAKDFLINEGFF